MGAASGASATPQNTTHGNLLQRCCFHRNKMMLHQLMRWEIRLPSPHEEFLFFFLFVLLPVVCLYLVCRSSLMQHTFNSNFLTCTMHRLFPASCFVTGVACKPVCRQTCWEAFIISATPPPPWAGTQVTTLINYTEDRALNMNASACVHACMRHTNMQVRSKCSECNQGKTTYLERHDWTNLLWRKV